MRAVTRLQNIANGLRSQCQMAVLFAMLDRRFHHLLDRGTHEERLEFAGESSDMASLQFAAGIAARTP